MGITVSDLQRAISGGGDVAAFAESWRQALVNPPVPSVIELETPVALAETTALLKDADKRLSSLVAAWVAGRKLQQLPETKIDLTLIGLAPYGRNTGSYLAHVIDEVKPDIIVIDTSPIELSANMLYAFGMPCAAGLAVYGEIMTGDFGQFYTRQTFYPGNTNETAIVKSWLMKIPLLPVGVPRLKPRSSETDFMTIYADETSAERERYQPDVLQAYRALDQSLSGVTQLQQGLKISRDICSGLLKSFGSKMRETLIEESCYIASRIIEVAAQTNTSQRPERILAIVDIGHYPDVEYTIDFLSRGVADEIYLPPASYATAKTMLMVSRNSDELNDQAKQYTPEVTLTQRLFQSELKRQVAAKDSEILAESEGDRLIPEIVSRTRCHQGIARGASVRGTIACKEVAGSFSEIENGLTRGNIHKAALITLPPRIAVKQGYDEIALVDDIVKEVLYDISFSRTIDEASLTLDLSQLSAEEILAGIKNLESLPQQRNQESPQQRIPAVIDEQDKTRELLKQLEANKLLKKGQRERYSLAQKAIDYLMNDLERRLKAGEITPADYEREKDRLTAMLKNASKPGLKMSAKELADTIMELMDAQDKQWSSELSFERMHVYYHIKENSQGEKLSPQKRDYYRLKMLIDDLEKQGVLMTAETTGGFVLTSEALDILLEYLIGRDSKDRGLQGVINFGKVRVNERKHEVRRYTTGDVFRDISIRHTLREIVRQKKVLSAVSSSDFRVFMKQHRKLQSDIVLCLDTSGSMGFQHKLMYARLAASGLAKAAIANGDRVGMVAFDNFSKTTIPLSDQNNDAVTSCASKLYARGNTNIGDGIKSASQLLLQGSNQNQKYILLITDGQPTAISQGNYEQLQALAEKDLTEESAILEVRKAVARGINVSVLHVAGRHEDSGDFVKNIARVGRGEVRRVGSVEELTTIMHR